jgi:hypothetical protein
MILLGLWLALVFGRAEMLPLPQETETFEHACQAQGGRVTTSRGGEMQCLLPQPDEGRVCSTALDCAGYCIGGEGPDHGTCSRYPVGPGCLSLLNETGAEVTLCID